ncbi:armadillo-type protein [Mycena amicta]|nr:armadillo-type protein [Mycena amicta]
MANRKTLFAFLGTSWINTGLLGDEGFVKHLQVLCIESKEKDQCFGQGGGSNRQKRRATDNLCLRPLYSGQEMEFHADIRHAIPIVLKALKDLPSKIPYIVAEALNAIATLCVLAAQVEYQADIKAAIPLVVEALQNNRTCEAGFECLSALGAQLAFQAEIRPVIPFIVEALKGPVLRSRRRALACLGGLGAQGMSSRRPLSSTDTVFIVQFQADIQAASPTVVEGLEHPDPIFRWGTLEFLAALSAQVEFQTVIRAAIPAIVAGMNHSDSHLRRATLVCIKDLGVEGMFAFQAALRTAIPSVVEAMKDPDRYVRRAACICLGALGAQVEFQTEIRPVIPILVEELIASSPHFDEATIACIGALGAQGMFYYVVVGGFWNSKLKSGQRFPSSWKGSEILIHLMCAMLSSNACQVLVCKIRQAQYLPILHSHSHPCGRSQARQSEFDKFPLPLGKQTPITTNQRPDLYTTPTPSLGTVREGASEGGANLPPPLSHASGTHRTSAGVDKALVCFVLFSWLAFASQEFAGGHSQVL